MNALAQVIWWRRGGSNSRPSHCERDALPAELRPRRKGKSIVIIAFMGRRVITLSSKFHVLSQCCHTGVYKHGDYTRPKQ